MPSPATKPMRRRLVGFCCASASLTAMVLAVGVGSASAAADPGATCTAIFNSEKAFGNVGKDTSFFATMGPGIVGEFYSTNAHLHAGGLAACFAALPPL